MDKKRQQTKKEDRHTKRKKDRQINKGQTIERDHREIIFASLYTTMKNKMSDIFLSGQNQCYSTRVKKSYFGHTFYLTQKSFLVGRWVGGVESDFSVSLCPFLYF